MSNKDLKKWFEEDLTVSPEDMIDEERKRIEKAVRNQDGKMIPNDASLSRPKQIASIFVGAFVAETVGVRDSSIIETSEVVNRVDGDKNNVTANLSDLKNKQAIIESVGDGKNRLIPSKLTDALDYILGER